jgi:hypothetical protein
LFEAHARPSPRPDRSNPAPTLIPLALHRHWAIYRPAPIG